MVIRGDTRLIGKYSDTLLVAYVSNAQNHIFLIAFAFVESKNKDIWF